MNKDEPFTGIVEMVHMSPHTNELKTLVDGIKDFDSLLFDKMSFYTLDEMRRALKRIKTKSYKEDGKEKWFDHLWNVGYGNPAWVNALECKGWKELYVYSESEKAFKENRYWDGVLIRPLLGGKKCIVGHFRLTPYGEKPRKKRRRNRT